MKYSSSRWLIGLVVVFLLAGCNTVKSLSDYSGTSLHSLGRFEAIDFGFVQYKTEAGRIGDIDRHLIDTFPEAVCNCPAYRLDDSITLLLYTALKSYFDGLAKLAGDEYANYSFDALKNAVAADSSIFKISGDTLEAYNQLAATVTKYVTLFYREKKLEEYITSSNASVQLLLHQFERILREGLSPFIDRERRDLIHLYKNVLYDPHATVYEKDRVAADYYEKRQVLNYRREQLDTYLAILQAIREGHQEAAVNIGKKSKKDLKTSLNKYADSLKNAQLRFDTLKK